MEVEVYVDVVFMINFIMDFFILWVVNKIARKEASIKRLLIGSFLGAMLICFMLFIPVFNVIYNMIGFIILGMILVVTTFKINNIKEFLKLFILLHLTAFTIGGTGVALFYYTNIGLYFQKYINEFSLKILVITTILSYIMIKLFMLLYGRYIQNKRKYYTLKIKMDDKNVEFNGMIDTGNYLCDPFTKSPVIIVELSAMNNILPRELLRVINENKETDLNVISDISSKFSIGRRLRLIPYSTLNSDNCMLLGFRPDYIEIISNEKTKKQNNVIIAIVNKKLAKDDSYQALINPELLEEGE